MRTAQANRNVVAVAENTTIMNVRLGERLAVNVTLTMLYNSQLAPWITVHRKVMHTVRVKRRYLFIQLTLKQAMNGLHHYQ